MIRYWAIAQDRHTGTERSTWISQCEDISVQLHASEFGAQTAQRLLYERNDVVGNPLDCLGAVCQSVF